MPPKPSASTSYRDPDQDDDDDLDDLDDVLASFNAPKPSSSTAQRVPASSSQPPPITAPSPEGDEDFEASLIEGMESLLRQLAGDHPPGPMPDLEASRPVTSPGEKGGDQLSAADEEKAWQKAVEMMLSGEGLEALGLDKDGDKPAPPVPQAEGKPDFQETIRRTMESLNQRSGARGVGADGAPPNLAALMAQLGSDPSALDGVGGDDDQLGGLLDGMMAQLMTRDVLEEPMSELASKYPAYLASPPPTASQPDLTKYRRQHDLVERILDTFRRPGYTDERDGKEIAKLVGEMQDLGGPPKEIMGELPEGFDLGALGGDEGCTVM